MAAWFSYALYYTCRANLSIAFPLIMSSLGYSKTELGIIGSGLFFTYAIGQVINGQLGDLLGARKVVTLGIIGSSLANLLFGFTGGLFQMVIIWSINGYFQSMGFSPNVKLIGDWFSSEERGSIMGLYGSCYQIGNAASWILSSYLALHYNWRFLFWVPSIIFLLSSVPYYLVVRDNPQNLEKNYESIGLRNTIKYTLLNRDIWLIAFSFFFVDIVRYGFFMWAPTFLFEVQNASISSAALKVVIIPITGSIGAILTGKISQDFLDNKRAKMTSVLLALLGITAYVYPLTPVSNWLLGLFELALIGFFTYGAHVTIVASMPVDFSTDGASASATGFIDGFGYLGALTVSYLSGYLADNYGWSAAFNFWIISAFIASVILIPLWNKKPIK